MDSNAFAQPQTQTHIHADTKTHLHALGEALFDREARARVKRCENVFVECCRRRGRGNRLIQKH